MKNNILSIAGLFIVVLMGLLLYFNTPTNLDKIFSHVDQSIRFEYAMSFFFTVFVIFQFWNLFNAKAFMTGKSAFSGLGKESSGFLIVLLLILVGQYLIVTFGGDVFRTVPLQLRDWALILGGTSIVLWLGEIARLFKKNK